MVGTMCRMMVRGKAYQIPRPISVTLNASHPKSPTAMTVSRLTEEPDFWSGAAATLESIVFSSGYEVYILDSTLRRTKQTLCLFAVFGPLLAIK